MLNLLTELGEFFGEFRKRDGSTVSFRQQINQKYNIDLSSLNPPVLDPKTNPFLESDLCKKFSQNRYYEWQKRVIQTLQSGNDVYVVAPPGGGVRP